MPAPVGSDSRAQREEQHGPGTAFRRPCCPCRACPFQSHSRRISCLPPLWCLEGVSGPVVVVVVVVVDRSGLGRRGMCAENGK